MHVRPTSLRVLSAAITAALAVIPQACVGDEPVVAAQGDGGADSGPLDGTAPGDSSGGDGAQNDGSSADSGGDTSADSSAADTGVDASADAARCALNDKRCAGDKPQSCDANGNWGDVACDGYCKASSCVVPNSCAGGFATCGAGANGSCCSSPVVTGAAFNRSNNAAYPATISDFR